MFLILSLVVIINIIVITTFVMMFSGAPYVPSKNTSVERMMELANIKKGDKTADLGSGDGRIVIAMAQHGAEAHGYDNNPVLVWVARRNIRRAGMSDTAFIHWKSFWKIKYDTFDTVTVYAMPYIMNRLYRKLKKELKPGSKIISNAFAFPNQEPLKKDHGVYLYKV